MRTHGKALIAVEANGRPLEVADGSSVADVAALLGVGTDERGVAVALDGTVVRRADWSSTTLSAGARLEVVRATAGG